MLSKMGTGRLSGHHHLMAPLPQSWSQLSQQMSHRHQPHSQTAASDARAGSEGPSSTARAIPAGKGQRPQPNAKPMTADPKGRPERPNGMAQPTAIDQKSRQPKPEKASKPTTAAAPGHGAVHGLANGKQTELKGKGQTVKELSDGQKRPVWGAAQPPTNAARVAEARTFKVCRPCTWPCMWQHSERHAQQQSA